MQALSPYLSHLTRLELYGVQDFSCIPFLCTLTGLQHLDLSGGIIAPLISPDILPSAMSALTGLSCLTAYGLHHDGWDGARTWGLAVVQKLPNLRILN
jgi:hypothetical protein